MSDTVTYPKALWRPALAALLVSSVFIGFGWSAVFGLNSVTSLANVVSRLLVLLALGFTAIRPPGGVPRMVWVYLLLSWIFDLFAAGLWSTLFPDSGLSSGVPLSGDPITVPSADALQLLSYVILLLALWQLRPPNLRDIDWRVPLFDVVITLLSLSAVVWILILKSDVSSDFEAEKGRLFLELAYPLLDLSMLIGLMLVLINPPPAVPRSFLQGLTWLLLLYFMADFSAGMALYLAADLKPLLLAVTAVLTGAGNCAMGLTALYPHEASQSGSEKGLQRSQGPGRITRWSSSLSVAMLFFVVLLVLAKDGPDADFVIVSSMALIGLMLLMRQLVAAASIQAMLEAKVTLRTQEVARANASLEGANRSLRSLLDHTPLAIAAQDFDYELVLTNPAWDALIQAFPKLESQLRGFTSKDAVTEIRLDGSEGAAHYFLAGCTDYINELGQLGGVWLTVTDITAVKTRESQLQAMSRMASLGEMATGLAHEINQPLGALRLTLANLDRKIQNDGLQVDYLQEKLARMDDVIERINKLVSGMKSFGRINVSELEIFDLNKSAQSVCDLLEEQLTMRGLALKLSLSDEPVRLYGSPMQLEQVLINLLNNSADAILEQGGGGEIFVRVTRTKDAIQIIVEDNGPGFPDALMERLLEPFFTTKAPGKGTGLGLSYSQGIVSEMGGSLQLANTRDGARVTLSLPNPQRET